jgi:hypothetical protein
MTQHIGSIKRPNKASCRILANHFNNGTCKTFNVMIIEKVDDTLCTTEQREQRLKRETYYIEALKTRYPYGLNEKFAKEDAELSVYNNLRRNLKHKKRKRGKRKPRSQRHSTNTDQYLNDVHTLSQNNKEEAFKYTFKKSFELSNKTHKKIYTDLTDKTELSNWEEIIYDISATKIQQANKGKQENTVKRKPDTIIKLKFSNKYLDLINLSQILRSTNVKNSFPNDEKLTKYKLPGIIYSYDKPMSAYTFNYRQAIENIDINCIPELTCRCETYTQPDTYHKHVITGDPSFIKNKKLRAILSKSPSYRITNNTTTEYCLSILKQDITEYVDIIYQKYPNTEMDFSAWIKSIMQAATQNIQNKPYPSDYASLNQTIKKDLELLQKDIVITRTDKAGQNYAFICQKLYKRQIAEELGTLTGGNATYEIIASSADQIITNLIQKSTQLQLPYDSDLSNLPFIQLLIKFHKTPIKFRTIISSSKAFTKIASEKVAMCLKLITKRMMNYCSTIRTCTSINAFWIINNNKPIIDTMEKLSKQNKAVSISTFDFTTLYTTIDHHELISKLSYIVDLAFKSSRHKFIRIYHKSATWSNSEGQSLYFDKNKLIEGIRFIIENTFITFGKSIFRQKVGIPMGTNSAPDMANLFLFAQEFLFIKTNLRVDFSKCFTFRYVYRYLDDITAINDNDYLGLYYKDIYHQSLSLVKVNTQPDSADVLDIHIEIKGKKFHTKVYDKRDDFPFSINMFPDITSNISINTVMGVYTSQVIRFGRISSNTHDFLSTCAMYTHKLQANGYPKRTIKMTFIKCMKRRKQLISKFNFRNAQHAYWQLKLKLDSIHSH